MDTHAALAISAAAFLAAALLSGYVKNRVLVSEPLLFMLLGAALGPWGLQLIDLNVFADDGSRFLEQAARITVAISVMGAALRLPRGFFLAHGREMAVVLALGMGLMWLASGLLAAAILPVTATAAALLGAILTPTDPVISASIVTGRVAERRIPGRLRHSLSAEAGANDGLALLFVMAPVLLLRDSAGEALHEWLLRTLLWEVGLAVALGVLIGWLAGRALRWSRRQAFTEKTSLLMVSLALTLTVLAFLRLLQSDGILAVFVAGLVFNRFVQEDDESEQGRIQEAISRLFELPVFILFGMALPWADWLDNGWPPLLFALAVLLLRRLPAWLLLRTLLPSLRCRREVLFAGWFGPVGIAAVFYATKAEQELGMHWLWEVTSLVIFVSILAHGVTATPLARIFEQAEARERPGAADTIR